MATPTERGSERYERAVTASAWVLQGGVFPFMIGPDQTGEALGVVRLGGHIEPGETPWQCAVREVREEASLEIEALAPPATLRLQEDQLSPVPWEEPTGPPPTVFTGRAVYSLARTAGPPRPQAEARGLLLLSHEEVLELASSEMTLGEYLAAGGRAILRDDLPELPLELPLKPTGPRLLAKVLRMYPALGVTEQGA